MKDWHLTHVKTAMKKTFEELYSLAYVDTLTTVYNRNAFEDFRNSFEDKTLYVAIADIDDLKSQNDLFGHESGDFVIRSVANRLKTLSSYVFRLGGDEFLILSHRSFTVDIKGVSAGIVLKNKNTSLSDAMKSADKEMYIVKKIKQLG